jgi:hypothetical protein
VLLDERIRARGSVRHEPRCGLSSKNVRRESVTAIRVKNRIWRVPRRREAGKLENFFIAKNSDSESDRRAFRRLRSVSPLQAATSSSNARTSKTCVAQVFLAISMIVCVVVSHAIRVVTRARYDVDEKRA